jgi:hypothetical protein
MENQQLLEDVALVVVELQPIDLSEFEQFSNSSGCGSDFSCPTTGCK